VASTATAWRCSQCGTVNEPGARACRECGKWPSLFDLQDSVVEGAPLEEAEPIDVFQPETFETETFEPDTFQPEVFGEDEADETVEAGEPARRFPRWLITVAVVVGWILWYVAGNYLFPD
jgi:hypothetical protein